LLKPVTYFAFSEELKNVLVKLNKQQRRTIMMHSEDGVTLLNIADILFVESVGRVLKLHSMQGEFRLNDTLADLEKSLNDTRFFRCHRGCLVNLYFVERVKNNDILIGSTWVPLSRYKKEEFEDALIKVMGEAL
jgi:DNA-binding LytR/AlgR family response regulator